MRDDQPTLPDGRPIVRQTISHEFMLQTTSTPDLNVDEDISELEDILEAEVNELEQLLNAIVWVESDIGGFTISCMPATSEVDREAVISYYREMLQRMQHRLFEKLNQGQITLEHVD